MGSYQTKCSCGKFSEYELIVISNQDHKNAFGEILNGDFFNKMNKISGYKGWSCAPFSTDQPEFKAYPCGECVNLILEKLIQNSEQIDGIIKNKSENGYWKTDFP